MDRADVLFEDVKRLVEEAKRLKEVLVTRDDEIRQLKNANKELLDALHDCEDVEIDEDSEF
jgi:predicted nuclease with TOPRIM domain